MGSALYGMVAGSSSSSKNQEGVVWVPGDMKGASVSKRIQRGAERVLLTDRMSFAYLIYSTPALCRDIDAG